MATPEGETGEARGSFWPVAAALGALVLCCGGPVLAALVVGTGLGVLVTRSGPYLAAGAAAAAALAATGVLWRRRWACAGPGLPGARCAHGVPRNARGDADEHAHTPPPRELDRRPSR